jgi:PAS domain S-box-containing protein
MLETLQSPAAPQKKRAEPKVNILLVDDQPANLLALEAVLDSSGANLVTAPSGEEALRRILNDDFAVILLDVQMQGMDGFETARLIRSREKSRNTPIIFLTAYDTSRYPTEEAYALGAVDYLMKPVVPTMLRAKVGVFIDLYLKTEQIRRQAEQLRQWEQRQAEQALRDSNARHAAILETALDAIISIDQFGKIIEFNPAAEKTFGYNRSEVMRKSMAELIIPPSLRKLQADGMARYLATGESPILNRRIEITAARADGTEFPVEVTVTRISGEGSPLFTAYVRDITDRKRLEEEFRQAQKMESIGRMAGGVAHDFNNVLTAIRGYADMLASGLDNTGPLHQHAEEIKRAAERGASLTRQLLIFSRKETVTPRIVDLNTLVTNMGNMLRRLLGEDIEITTELATDLGHVKADPCQIEQVVMNLAVNARDAMRHGGKLTIETCNAGLDATICEMHPDARPGPYVRLRMTDTGCGMSDETKAHLFEPFFTTKEAGKGTGLGLATIYGIVKQSKGHIEVSSRLGQGTTFTIYVPRVAQAVSECEKDTVSTHPKSGTETILLVEDEEMVRSLMRTIFEQKGYTVLEACQGDEALAVCKRHPGPIDLLVTDIMMPRINGWQLAERLAQIRPTIKVLFLSGYRHDVLVNDGLLKADSAFVQKPFKPEDLARKVREVLAR